MFFNAFQCLSADLRSLDQKSADDNPQNPENHVQTKCGMNKKTFRNFFGRWRGSWVFKTKHFAKSNVFQCLSTDLRTLDQKSTDDNPQNSENHVQTKCGMNKKVFRNFFGRWRCSWVFKTKNFAKSNVFQRLSADLSP